LYIRPQPGCFTGLFVGDSADSVNTLRHEVKEGFLEINNNLNKPILEGNNNLQNKIHEVHSKLQESMTGFLFRGAMLLA